MARTYDYLVLGSGIAGLSYALKVANRDKAARIAIITKSDEDESNTKYAQGGVAVVMNIFKDSAKKHIKDTLIAGDGLCDKEVVSLVVNEAKDRLEELIAWGVDFDREESGEYALGLEGGHTEHRILHHKDITGLEIERKLVARVRTHEQIDLFDHHFAVDLLTEHHVPGRIPKGKKGCCCYGAYVLDEKAQEIHCFKAQKTLIATGGIGQVYRNTTNPIIATGDGIGMAYRAGARIAQLEFVQFHPTALAHADTTPSFLISEAVRGFGAQLRNEKGERFMPEYDPRAELAPRDIVSRAIDRELKRSGARHVGLDCRHLDQSEFREKFPNIYEKVRSLGIDPSKHLIPVAPAAHYLCGGIKTDHWGQTTLKHLYAVGETSCTGLHGANRLASNSLLEALVFAHRACLHSVENKPEEELPDIPEWNKEGTSKPREKILITFNRKQLRDLMSDYVGITRNDERLKKAVRRLAIMFEENEELYKRVEIGTEILELRNMLSTSYLIVQQSLKRKKNAGVFYKD
jgi:L-aspartate oxidase